MVRVLVVDDDQLTLRSVAYLLQQEGYGVVTAATGGDAIEEVERGRPDVILLDIGLPDVGGVEVCRRLRERTSVPIIFLTARRAEAEKVVALDAGGDDYVTKPFGVAELAARIRAVLRRSRSVAGPLPEQLAGGGIVLDRGSHRILVRGEEVALTPREFDLLHFLMANAGRAVDRQRIFDAVWGIGFFGDQNALDVYVRQLRRKIERDPDQPELIQTVRGVGYRFAEPGDAE